MSQLHWKLGFLAVALTCFGCGGGAGRVDTVPAQGTVYVDDNPHGPASLILYPKVGEGDGERPSVSGEVAADGSFTLFTYEPGDGAPPGTYSATLGAGSTGGTDSTDPNAMMAAMGGGSVSVDPVDVEIPADGSTSLEIRFKSAGKKGGSQAQPGDLLGG